MKKLLFVILIASLIFGCEKEELIEEPTITESITICPIIECETCSCDYCHIKQDRYIEVEDFFIK